MSTSPRAGAESVRIRCRRYSPDERSHFRQFADSFDLFLSPDDGAAFLFSASFFEREISKLKRIFSQRYIRWEGSSIENWRKNDD